MYSDSHRFLMNGKKSVRLKIYRLLKNPLCLVPLLLLLFILSLYLTLESALGGNYFPRGSFRFDSHEKYKYRPVKFEGERIVHLDLKGALPKIAYLKEIFKIVARFGATAILIDYDDAFPFDGKISSLKSPLAYTLSDVEEINRLADMSNLKIIPLIQTFSHMEYVLKYNTELREAAAYPTDICPTNEDAKEIISIIIQQILKVHYKSGIVHIGADKVDHLKKCEKCKKGRFTPTELFLNHIKTTAESIKDKFPSMRVLVWDDVLRQISSKDIMNSKLRDLIEPAISYYETDAERYVTEEVINKYDILFGSVWIAGSFKGTTGPDAYLTKSTLHIHNIQSWLTLYRKYKDMIEIPGMILMGYQRYDRLAILCELLPVSVPSLTLTLSLLQGIEVPFYTFPPKVAEVLRCIQPHSATMFGNGQAFCSYHGGTVLDGVLIFHELKLEFERLKKSPGISGWMSYYNLKRGVYNMKEVEGVVSEVWKFRKKLTNLSLFLKNALNEIYYPSVVSEWMETHLEPIFNDVSRLFDDAQKLMKIIAWTHDNSTFSFA